MLDLVLWIVARWVEIGLEKRRWMLHGSSCYGSRFRLSADSVPLMEPFNCIYTSVEHLVESGR